MVILMRSTTYLSTVKPLSHNPLAIICQSHGKLWTPDQGEKSGQTRFDLKKKKGLRFCELG